MAMGLVLVIAFSAITVSMIEREIDETRIHNEQILERSQQIETEADLIAGELLPTFKALHTLDVAVTRHLAEFELLVMDSERDLNRLAQTDVAIATAFGDFPQSVHHAAMIDGAELEEVVDVFHDITIEAIETGSPHQLSQLLEDSEDIFMEFRAGLDQTRRNLDLDVATLGREITSDAKDTATKIFRQQGMLEHLHDIATLGTSLLILVVLLATLLIYRSLYRRLAVVADYARSIERGEYQARIDFTSRDRIGEMADSVSQMGARMATLVKESEHRAATAEAAEKAARKLAYFDSLTELPNRQHFFDMLAASIEEARQIDGKVAVIYLDLDDFKKVNDSYGHNVGDELLCAVAKRFRHATRKDDALGCNVCEKTIPEPSRLGGDEFTFLLTRLHDVGEAEKIARRILQVLIEPYPLADREIRITPSLGVAVYPDDGAGPEQLLTRADMAMYQAKRSGPGSIRFYSEEVGAQHLNRINLERDLSHALANDQLQVVYQPKVDLLSKRIVGAEALLRWHHPERGMVSPGEFIPLAEDTGLIVPIGNWVLRKVCHQLAAWYGDGKCQVPVAVNVSAKQLAQGGFLSTVQDCLETAGIGAETLELELTESSLMQDTELAVAVLKSLRSHNIRVSLDDFGTGYSSLSYLKRFPLDALKIDQGFVRDIEVDPDDAAIVSAIIALAGSLGMDVIAEGVETPAQVTFLRDHGCRLAQGYLFSRPIPADEFTGLLRGNPAVSPTAASSR